jgi:hypothetical protein
MLLLYLQRKKAKAADHGINLPDPGTPVSAENRNQLQGIGQLNGKIRKTSPQVAPKLQVPLQHQNPFPGYPPLEQGLSDDACSGS